MVPLLWLNYWLQVIDFLSTVIDNRDVTAILLQPLIKVGLISHTISLLASEIEKLSDEGKLDRYGEYYACELGQLQHIFVSWHNIWHILNFVLGISFHHTLYDYPML